jgi:hypothetical protein
MSGTYLINNQQERRVHGKGKKDVIYLMSIRPEPSAKLVTEVGNS